MKIIALAGPLLCLAMFHTPDGKEFRLDTRQITAVRPTATELAKHVAPGTSVIIYAGGRAFGVMETLEQAQTTIRNCVDGER
jgi:hypothetical protein